MTSTMKQGSVVVGVDDSPGGAAALSWAVRYAALRRRPLLIVNGAGDPRDSAELLGPEEARTLLRAAARLVADEALGVARGLAPDLDVEVSTPVCDARDALIDCSATASLTVVGTRGRGPVRSLLMGSVSTAVVAHASSPVAVVREVEPDQARGHVVVGVDAGPSSTELLEYAFELASTESRDLDVVHSWSTHDTFVDWTSYEQRLERMDEHERAFSESMAGYQEKYPDVSVVRHLPEAGPAQTLVALSRTAATVVVGSRGRTGARAVFGSVSREVVEHAHCTVIVVQS